MAEVDDVVDVGPMRPRFSTEALLEVEHALDQEPSPAEAPESASGRSTQEALDEVSETRGRALGQLKTLLGKITRIETAKTHAPR